MLALVATIVMNVEAAAKKKSTKSKIEEAKPVIDEVPK